MNTNQSEKDQKLVNEEKASKHSSVVIPKDNSLKAEPTPRPWKVSYVRWNRDGPVLGFAIRPADRDVLMSKRGVSIAALNCAEPAISAEAMYRHGEMEANAELIVRAVNLFPTMVAAFEKINMLACYASNSAFT